MVVQNIADARGTRYTDEQKEIAYKVWAFQANRNAAKTARLLATMEDDSFTVTRRSVYDWSKEFHWEDRANRDLYSAAPSLRFKTQTALILSAPQAAELLQKIIALDESLKVERSTLVDGEWHVERVFDDKVLKLQLTAAQLVLDRTGFSPVGTRDVGAVDSPPEMNSEWRAMLSPDATEEELAAAVERIRSEAGVGIKVGGSVTARTSFGRKT